MYEKIMKRTEKFRSERFGMFIHWGLYAIPGRGEWVRHFERISNEDYRNYYDEFDPTEFDPREWAAAAKAAGMKYAVLTAKHHDGFCMFDSALTDYKCTNTKCGRDLVGEYVQAFREAGLGVGLYYSLLDWHHPDYPHYDDPNHPMRQNPAYKDYKYNFENYLEYMHGQVRELCTNYGKIDIMWFDFSYGELFGEKWGATELVRMARALQPDMIIDNRLEASGSGFGSLASGNPSEFSGDFASPENVLPPEGILDATGRPIPWEACITMNNHWGYCSADKDFKAPDMIIKKLVECVSKDGNLLLNVGPNARGRIPDESLEVLSGVGKWMRDNSESIYGCGCSGLGKPENGRITKKGNVLYYHVMENSFGFVPLYGIDPEKIKFITLLSDGSERGVIHNWMTDNYKNVAFVEISGSSRLPDGCDTVLKIEMKAE